jgi:peptidoglycan/xylan/chitin deacetylase (PgdA/CDA1 family)
MLKNRTVNIIFFLVLLTTVLSDVFGEVSPWTYIPILVIYSAIQVVGSAILSIQFFVPVKFEGDRSQSSVAITFDDGPLPGKTERILDILQTHRAVAAFFCIGYRVNENADLVARIKDEGHVLGNHSYWHAKTFDLQTSEKIAQELRDTDTAIEKHLGRRPRFFRPPYGVTNPMVASAIRKGNYITVGWSLRSFDTMISDPSRLLKKIKQSLKAGDIILFHDQCESTIEILPALLDHISQVGLKIVRVDELLNEKAYV